jgi:folate-binding protein YgfZ
VDIRNTETARDLPQETGQTRALHFSKGCYLGQEIVERIRSRGQVHRSFGGFLLTGELPDLPAGLQSDGKAAGEITSAMSIDHPTAGPLVLALGYARREALERGAPLVCADGLATPVSLPFRPA